MSVQAELERLTGIKPSRRESDQGFFERIIKALDDVKDLDYNKLSKAAQAWAEEATEAYNAEEQIAAFPEADDEEDEAEETDDTESEDEPEEDEAEDDGESEPEDDDMPATRTEEDEAPRRRKTTAPAKKAMTGKSKSKIDKKTDGKTGKGVAPKAGGGLTYVRELLVKNPDIPVAELSAKVKAKGHTVSVQTLHTTRSGFRQDVRALQNAGLLKRTLV